MKKTMILSMLLMGFSVLAATVLTWEMVRKSYRESLNLHKSYYDGLLTAFVEFSQEEYVVGDTVDVTIHLEVNTTKNTDNSKFVIKDYKTSHLYSIRHVTKEDIQEEKERLTQSNLPLKLLDSDSDLILSNENPTGNYHITFMLMRKCRIQRLSDTESYPYKREVLRMYRFTETITKKYITHYLSHDLSSPCTSLVIPIKLHPDALRDETPIRKSP
jgi:hypothetical protein